MTRTNSGTTRDMCTHVIIRHDLQSSHASCIACHVTRATRTLAGTSLCELLLPAGIALKITGVLPKDASGLTIITCEDDTDAPALIS